MTTYVTVAIPYVNAAPHLGYAYELVQADIFARARRLAGDDVRFLAGTDDHSLKNVLAAAAAGVPTAEFVDANAARLRRPRRAARRSPTTTTSARAAIHATTGGRAPVAGVRGQRRPLPPPLRGRLLRRVRAVLRPRPSSSTACCPEHGTPLERVAEENWFFRLSAYQDHLERADLVERRLRITPEPFRQEVLAFVRAGLHDISVSRSVGGPGAGASRVPDDPSQVVYVWFDALDQLPQRARLRRSGERRTGDVVDRRRRARARRRQGHRALPRRVLAGVPRLGRARPPRPASRSTPTSPSTGPSSPSRSGNGVEPAAVAAAYGTDALRWWFARDVSPVADTDFTPSGSSPSPTPTSPTASATSPGACSRSPAGEVSHRRTSEPVGEPDGVVDAVLVALGDFDLRSGDAAVTVAAVGALNREIEAAAPWKLLADPGDARRARRPAGRWRHARTSTRCRRSSSPSRHGAESRARSLSDGLSSSTRRGAFSRLAV